MAITDKEQGVWELEEVYNKINEGGIWTYTGANYVMWGWGQNQNGQLAQNSGGPTVYSSPIQLPGEGWSKIKKTSSNGGSLATKSDGTLWAWGVNDYGLLGLNDTNKRSSPVQLPGTTWSTISGNGSFTFVTKTDGTLWTMGRNNSSSDYTGELGLNDAVSRSSPTQLPGTTWGSADDKMGVGAMAAFNIKTDGTLWGMGGRNENGELGQNNTTHYSSPVQIGTQTTWSKVTGTGMNATIATKTDGTLWVWGNPTRGQLGLNNGSPSGHRSSPTQLPGTDWGGVIDGGGAFVFAIKTNGELWGWGQGKDGHLGNNSVTYYSSPIQIGTDTTWNAIEANASFTIATKTDGTLWNWGQDGRLGVNTGAARSSPVQIPGTWTTILGGAEYSTYALKQ
tara:strand:- start:395 stop:1576 length:1182 start_codon:yes stop_codon:yes gene_type:complete